MPARGIGDVTMERLARARAGGRACRCWEAHAQRGRRYEDLPAGAAEKVGEFLALIERYREAFDQGNLAEVTRKLLEEIGFKEAARALTASADRGGPEAQVASTRSSTRWRTSRSARARRRACSPT